MSDKQQILFEIYLENEEFKVRAKEATDGLDKVGDSAKKSEGIFSKLKNSWVATTLAVGAVVVAFTKFANALGETIQYASKLQETQNKFDVVFKNNRQQAQAFAKTLVESYGLAKEEAMSFLAGTGDILTGLGMQSEKALELSNSVAQLGVDLASFSNVEGGAERAIQALTSSLTGEREALKAYGIVINEDMINQKLRAEQKDKLTGLALQQAKAEATLQIAYEQSGNSIGDMQRSFDSYANIQRRVNSQMADMKAEIGAGLLPAMSNLGLAFLSASKDGNIFAVMLQTIVKFVGDVINGYAIMIAYFNQNSITKKNDQLIQQNKQLMEIYKAQQKHIQETYGSVDGLNKKASEGDKLAQNTLKSYNTLRETLKGNLNYQAEQLEKQKDASNALIKIKQNMADAENGITQAVQNREQARAKENETASSAEKKRSAQLAPYYEAMGKYEDVALAKVQDNFQKTLDDLKTLDAEKLNELGGYEQAKADIEAEFAKQSEIAQATSWQQKQQAQLAYYRATWGFESKAFQGSMMLAQAGMALMNEKNKVLFRVGQASTVANIIMSTAEAIMKGFSYGPGIGIPYATLVGTVSALQIGRTLQQKPPEEMKMKNVSAPTASFAVGTWNVPYDMTANIHKDEIIIPKTFADSVRSGEASIGGGSGGGINIYVQGSVIDTYGLLKIVDDAQDEKSKLMGASRYTFGSAY